MDVCFSSCLGRWVNKQISDAERQGSSSHGQWEMERKKDFQPLGWGRREEQGKDYAGEASESQHPPYTEMSLEIAELFS